jgi:hypothetical protein
MTGVLVAAGIGVSVGAVADWLGRVSPGRVAVNRGRLFVVAVDGRAEQAASSRPGTKQNIASVGEGVRAFIFVMISGYL